MPNPEMRSAPREEKTIPFSEEITQVAKPEMDPVQERSLSDNEKTEIDYEITGRIKMVKEFADKRDRALVKLKDLETNPLKVAPEELKQMRGEWKKVAQAYDDMVDEALGIFESSLGSLDPQTKDELTQLKELTVIPGTKTEIETRTIAEEFDNELTIETVGPTEMIYIMKKQLDKLKTSNAPDSEKLEELIRLSEHAYDNINTITNQYQNEVFTDPKIEKEFTSKIEDLRNLIQAVEAEKSAITGQESDLDKMAVELKKDVDESKTPIQKPLKGFAPGVVKREVAESTRELSPEALEKIRVDVDIMKAELVTLYTDRSIPKKDFIERLSVIRDRLGIYLNQITGKQAAVNEVAKQLIIDISSMYSSTETEFGRESWVKYQPGLAQADIRFDDMATVVSQEVTQVGQTIPATQDIPFANPEDVIALDSDMAEKTQVKANSLSELIGDDEKTEVDQPKAT